MRPPAPWPRPSWCCSSSSSSGLVKLAATDHDVSGLPFTAYLVLAAADPPIAFVWAATERTRWGTAVIVVGALAMIALEFRLDQIWGG